MQQIFKFLVVIFCIYLVRRIFSSRASQVKASRKESASQGAESMVECAHCHLLVPESEGVKTGALYFCSTEHRQLGKKV